VLANADLSAYNRVGIPEIVKPSEQKQQLSGKKIVVNLDGYSLSVLRIPVKK
jgi:alpha-L-arabinofuranosidase